MTAILLILVMLMWLAVAAWFSALLTKRIVESIWRVPVAMLTFAVLLPLPLVDEIVGGRQFEKLCKENASIQINRATAVGKTVYFVPQPDVVVKGTWVRVVLKPQRFVDLMTGETIVSYNELIATGGWLIRALGISEGGMPLTFKGTCVPANRPASAKTFEPFGIKYVEPPLANR